MKEDKKVRNTKIFTQDTNEVNINQFRVIRAFFTNSQPLLLLLKFREANQWGK
jgi:hypothetical protein